jgi:hypothetical protein
MIMKTYVVSNELTTESERQARLKDLSTLWWNKNLYLIVWEKIKFLNLG